jgi:TetR/AcrR family transcriptional regulator
MPKSESSQPGSKRTEPGGKRTRSGIGRSKPAGKRGRMHDAEGTREAILNAAEIVFAEHGFDGARVDDIAEKAGYNKSLIFQYFDDKLGLYAAVVRRADDQTRVMQDKALKALRDEAAAHSPSQLRDLMGAYVGQYFDYLIEHPQVMRIFNWEMAEGWQTFAKILTQRDFDDVDEFAPIFQKFQKAGLIHTKADPMLQFTSAIFMSHVYLGVLPLYRVLLPDTDFSSPTMLKHAREFIVEFTVNGFLKASVDAQP